MNQISRNALTISYSLAIILGTFLIYSSLRHAGFIWDDADHLLNDRLLLSTDGLFRIWFNPEPSVWNYWPITRTTFWLERRWWGTSPFEYHLVNVILHILSSLVIFHCLKNLNIKGAWMAAAIFAAHPIMVESVAWITERKNVLSMFFYLLSIWTYIYFDTTKKNKWWLVLSFFFFIAGLLSKSSVIVLPFILILVRIWLCRTWKVKDIFILIPYFIIAFLAACLSIYFENNFIGASAIVSPYSFFEKINIANQALFFYIKKFFLPYPLISIYPPFEHGTRDLVGSFQFLFLLCVVAFLAFNYRVSWMRSLLLCLLAFFISIFPVLGFFQFSGMRHAMVADHWAYIATLPLCLFVGNGLYVLLSNYPKTKIIVVVIILLICGGLSSLETKKYYNEEIYWLTTLEKNPEAFPANLSLGGIYAYRNQLNLALFYTNRAISLGSQYDLCVAYTNRGAINQALGKTDAAVADYNKAISLEHNFSPAYYGLALLYAKHNNDLAAVNYFNQAIVLNKYSIEVRIALVLALERLGKDQQAWDNLTVALKLTPDNVTILKELIRVAMKLGRYDDAKYYYNRVSRFVQDDELESLRKLLVNKNQKL